MAKAPKIENSEGENQTGENQNETSTSVESVESVARESPSEKGKRQAKASITYVMPDGSEKNFPVAETNVIRIEIVDGTKRDFDVSALSDGVKHCALLQGVVTRFQRGYQALKEIDKVVESIDGTIEDLNNGIWLEVGTGEPRVTNLITAVVMALEAEGVHVRLVDGKVTDDHKKDISEKLAADENLRKATRERPVIASYLADMAAEAAKKRAEEKRKALSTMESDSSLTGF